MFLWKQLSIYTFKKIRKRYVIILLILLISMKYRNYMRLVTYKSTIDVNLENSAEFLARFVRETRARGAYPRRQQRMCDEEIARVRRERQAYLVLSFILLQASLQGDSRSRHRRCSSSGCRAIRGDASYAIAAWLALRQSHISLTHSNYSSLLSQNSERRENTR